MKDRQLAEAVPARSDANPKARIVRYTSAVIDGCLMRLAVISYPRGEGTADDPEGLVCYVPADGMGVSPPEHMVQAYNDWCYCPPLGPVTPAYRPQVRYHKPRQLETFASQVAAMEAESAGDARRAATEAAHLADLAERDGATI